LLLRWAIAAAASLAYLLGWLLGVGTDLPAEAPPPLPLVLLFRLAQEVLWPLMVTGLILLASLSAGAVLLRLIRVQWPAGCRALCAAALGLGASAYATLAFGMAGVLQRAALWGLMVAMVLFGWRALWPLLGELAREARQWASSWGRFERLLLLGALVLLLMGVLCAPTPVLDYDTLEYHLGAPGEYYAAGRVRFLPHNVYASFPAQVEMLYLLGIVLGGGKAAGMAVAVLLQVAFGALAACAVGAVAHRFVRREAAVAAAVFFLGCPLTMVTAVRAHITLARCFYLGVAVLALLEWLWGRGTQRERTRALALAGLCCGLAVAVKYTALLFVCLPFGLIVVVVSASRGVGAGRKVAPALLFAGCAVLAALPWLVKNLAATGNPVFPLFYGLLGGRGWSAEQAAKFAAAHAVPPLRSVWQLPVELWRFLTGYVGPMSPGFAGPLAVLFVPLLCAWRRNDETRPHAGRTLMLLGGYFLSFALLWAVATHRIARFLAPSLVLLAILSGAGFSAVQRERFVGAACRALALALLALAACHHATVAALAGGPATLFRGKDLADLARREQLIYPQAVAWVNDPRNTPPDALVLLVGDARTYLFDRPVLYSTVFNKHPIEPALALARTDITRAVRALHATGASYVLVNWGEVRRLSLSYSFRWQGRLRPGYLPQVDLTSREPLLGLLRAAGRPVARFGTMRWPRRDSPASIPVIELYDIRPVPAGHEPDVPPVP